VLAQLRDTLVGVPAVEVGDLEVPLRDLHAWIQLERPHEGIDRLLVQPLVVIEDAEIVVRAGVGRIDATREGAEDLAVPLRSHGTAVGVRRGGSRPGGVLRLRRDPRAVR
jgi:hypothetical protein